MIHFDFGSRTFVMGIVNVTPDSFSDGGKYFDPAAAIAHGVALVEAGADLLDVGGESTRPGAAEVSSEEELRRVVGVIAGLRRACPATLVSIDTSKAAVARAAVDAGAAMINDVTGLRGDPLLVKVAADTGVALCVMHMLGTPRTMQQDPRYGDVVEEVKAFLAGAAEQAIAAGVARNRILVDPGIGFGKTTDHNLTLVRRMGDFRTLGFPLLVGTSRKNFLGQVTGKPAPERGVATAATVAILAAAGAADVVRVHDVSEAVDAARVGDAVRFGYRPRS